MATNQHATTEELLEEMFSLVCAGTIARQQHGKHISAAVNQHPTIEELLETVFSAWSMPKGYIMRTLAEQELMRVIGGSEKGRLEFETVKYGHESHGSQT
jgi:hypothetical protein